MRSGRLRNKIRLERRTRTSDGGGGFVEGWETAEAGLSARIVTTSGRETAVADALAGVLTHEIFLRYSSRTKDTTNLMRAVNERTNVVYDIKAVWPDERSKVMKLVTQTGTRHV